MRKANLFTKLIVLCLMMGAQAMYAQVGVGNTDPKATLDVNKASYAAGEQAGIAVTQLTGEQIVAMTTTGLKAGTLVYATSTSGAITAIGYWYYNGNAWQQVGGASANLYTADGTLSGNRTVAQGTNTLAFTSAATTGTSHFTVDGSTFNVDAFNNRVGFGVNAPLAKVQIQESNGGAATYPLIVSNSSTTLGTEVGIKLAPTNTPDIRYAAISAVQMGSNRVDLSFTTAVASTITEKMRIKDEGNVIINNLAGTGSRFVVADATGTLSNNSGNYLNLSRTTGVEAQVGVIANSGDIYPGITSPADAYFVSNTGNIYIGSTIGNRSVSLVNGGNEALVVATHGGVGIGVNPSTGYRLYTRGGDIFMGIMDATTNIGYLRIGRQDNNRYHDIVATNGSTPGSNTLSFDIHDGLTGNSVTRGLTLVGSNNGTTGSVNVGIGSTTPASKLQVNGTFGLDTATSGTNNSVVLLASGTFTPPAANTVNGRVYIIRNTSTSANITVAGIVNYGASAAADFSLTPAQGAITIISNGTSWFRIQ